LFEQQDDDSMAVDTVDIKVSFATIEFTFPIVISHAFTTHHKVYTS